MYRPRSTARPRDTALASLDRRPRRPVALARLDPDDVPAEWKPPQGTPTIWCVECRAEMHRGDPSHYGHVQSNTKPLQGGAVNSASLSGALQKVYPTGFKAFDRVAGKHAASGQHGICEGQLIFLTGDPGAGKSTLLGRVCYELARRGMRGLYVSGEESVYDIAARMAREKTRHPRVIILATNSWEEVEREIQRSNPHVVIVDSLSRMGTMHGGPEGSAAAMQAVIHRTAQLSKHHKWPKGVFRPCFIIIQHINKKGQARGEVSLGHDVDTLMHLHRDDDRNVSELRSTKNRKGPLTRSVMRFADNRLQEVDTDAPPPQIRGLGEVGKIAAAVRHRGKIEVVMVEAVARTRDAEDKKPHERAAIGVASQHLEGAVELLSREDSAVHARHITVRVSGVDGAVRDPAVELPIALAVWSAMGQKRPPAMGAFGGLTLRGDVDGVTGADDRVAVLKGAGALVIMGPPGIGDTVGLRPMATLTHALNALDAASVGVIPPAVVAVSVVHGDTPPMLPDAPAEAPKPAAIPEAVSAPQAPQTGAEGPPW